MCTGVETIIHLVKCNAPGTPPVERIHDQTCGAIEIMSCLQSTVSLRPLPRCRVNMRMLTLLSSMPQNIVKYLKR
jgi:hypothetical protein